MKKSILYLLLLIVLTNSIQGQTNVSPFIKAQQALAQSVGLLTTHYSKTFTDAQDNTWKQLVSWRAEDSCIVYKMAPFEEDSPNDTSWYITHVIPVLQIDSLYGNYQDSTLTFSMKGYDIRSYQQDRLAAQNNFIRIHMPVGWVRNFVPRVNTGIKAYQQTFGNQVPNNARQIVSKSVYAFISRHQFNSDDVKKLLNQTNLYITKCQLCEGTRDAFRNYLTDIKITEPTNPDWEIGLLSPVQEEQMIVLEKMVNTAIVEYYQSNAGFTKAQIDQMDTMVKNERKASMQLANGKKCASCDGAACIKN